MGANTIEINAPEVEMSYDKGILGLDTKPFEHNNEHYIKEEFTKGENNNTIDTNSPTYRGHFHYTKILTHNTTQHNTTEHNTTAHNDTYRNGGCYC